MRAVLLGIALIAACGGGRTTPDAAVPATSANDLWTRGVPTFVAGTAGDDRSDRAIAAQVAMIRDMLFPLATIQDDTQGWPKNPIVYGGPHVNALIASVTLPFTISPGRLEIGGQVFEGDEYQVIAVIPAAADHPELLLLAGTGTPGIGEINARAGGAAMITIKDVFGILHTGTWKNGVAVLDPPARRIEWRDVERGAITVRFPAELAATEDEPPQVAAILRGIGTAHQALGVTDPPPITVYVYPDARSKQMLTGDGGNGHAVVEARALHVTAAPPDRLESLLAHEATHVLAYQRWGAAGTPLLGEGLAVWVAKQYGGRSLRDWRSQLETRPPLADLLKSFRTLPEQTTYPAAGLFVEDAVEQHGLEYVRDRLYPASASELASDPRD